MTALALTFVGLLAQAEVAPPAGPEAPSAAASDPVARRLRIAGLGLAATAVGAAGAAGAWADRDGNFGRACAITTGTLGTAFAVAGLSYLVVWLASGGLDARLEDLVPVIVSSATAAAIGLLVGLAGGAVGSTFASRPAGTQRGVVGIAGGGLMVGASAAVLIAAW